MDLKSRILLLDGAFSTYASSRYPVETGKISDLLNLNHPEIVAEIHNSYLEAGVDIIKTNTFNSNHLSLLESKNHHLVKELNEAAVAIARKCIQKFSSPKFVAGVIGPTNHSASKINGLKTIEFNQLVKIYSEQVSTLLQSGVDLLLIETIYDAQNAQAALEAIRNLNRELPVMVSVTISKDGKLLSGENIEEFLTMISPYKILSFGINCSFGAAQLAPYLEKLATQKDILISAHPNAGLPNKDGQYEDKEQFVSIIGKYIDRDLLRFVGGCCGTDPEMMRKLALRIKD